MRDARDGSGQIAVGEDDRRILAAHLDARRDPALGTPYAHRAAGLGRSRKDASIDASVDERRTRHSAALHDLHEPVRELSRQPLDQPCTASRRVFRGLEDESVARQKGGKDRAIQTGYRIVPGSDDADDTSSDKIYVCALAWKVEGIEENASAARLLLDDADPAADRFERAK